MLLFRRIIWKDHMEGLYERIPNHTKNQPSNTNRLKWQLSAGMAGHLELNFRCIAVDLEP